MRGRLAYLLYKLRASFWFVPGLMAAGAFPAAVACLAADAAGASALLRPLGAPFDIQEDAARELLSTLAGAMVTVVSLVFSLTLVTLTVAAGNLGVRLLERYMQNRVTQVTMGMFVGTFVFAIVVLSTVGAGSVRVPALSVTLALLHSLIAAGWLMYAFHDLARSLQIDQAAAEIGAALRAHIDDAAALGAAAREAEPGELPAGSTAWEITAGASGYVESLDWDALGGLAARHGAVIDLRVAQGDHVTPVDPVAVVHGVAGLEEQLGDGVRAGIALGSVRTEADDLMFLLHLLVEIAARALSPAVNDLYTAMACADHVTGALVHAFRQDLRPVTVRDPEGRLLVRTRSADISRMLDTALGGLRRNGARNTGFALRLIENIGRLAPAAAGHPLAPRVLAHLEQVAGHAVEGLPPVDREAVEEAAESARRAFRMAAQKCHGA